MTKPKKIRGRDPGLGDRQGARKSSFLARFDLLSCSVCFPHTSTPAAWKAAFRNTGAQAKRRAKSQPRRGGVPRVAQGKRGVTKGVCYLRNTGEEFRVYSHEAFGIVVELLAFLP